MQVKTKDAPLAEIDFGATPARIAAEIAEPVAQLPATLIPEATAIFQIIERAARDPNVDIDKLERLMGMQERMQAQQAELEFDSAMAAAQEEMEPVKVDAKNNQTNSKYASYHALDEAVRPIYSKHGFSLSFSTTEGAPENHIRVVCRVAHRGGHRERPYIDMPTDGKGPQGAAVMTKTHATGSGVMYGRRYLLAMIFNLAVDKDDDGNAAGGHRPGPAGSAGGGGQFRPERRSAPMPTQSSANGRRMAEDDAHLVDHDRQKGSLQRGKPPGRPENVQTWLDNAIGTLRLSTHTVESLDSWWRENDGERRRDGKLPPITWLREHDADGLDELETAFGNAKDAARARR